MVPPNNVINHHRDLFKAQRYLCYLCGERLYDHPHVPRSLRPSVDHVRPKSKGYSRRGNSLLAHERCNTRKGNRLPFACELLFLAAVNEIIPWLDWRRQHG